MKPMEPYLESSLPEMEECIRQFSVRLRPVSFGSLC